jgi:hypothetical protein
LSNIDPNSDHSQDHTLQKSEKKLLQTGKLLLLGLLLIAPLVACEPASHAEQAREPVVVDSSCGENGMLATRLFGGITADIEWSADSVRCESMSRPNSAGIRLRFTGAVDDEQLAFIIALPDLEPGQSGKEFASNVTVTVEGSGRFFSNPNMDSCWTDVMSEEQTAADDGRYTLTGTLYCVTPLGELNGDTAVSVTELSFASIVDWSNK